MADLHIDDFYKDAAKVLLQLYGVFPRKSIVYVEDISGADTPDEFGLHSERHESCFGAMIWLAETGYITYLEAIHREALDQVVLTHKAFTLLTARGPTPTELEQGLPTSVAAANHSHIALLREALKQGSSIAIAERMQLIMAQAHDFN